MSDDPLHRFAVRVQELQHAKTATPTLDPDAMAAVARDLGMSEADLIKMKEEAKGAKTRAETLRRAGALDPAIDTLETAHAFHPLDIEVTYALADALFSRSQKSDSDMDWERAKSLALAVIDAAPAHTDAAVLLKAIGQNQPSQKDRAIPWGVIIGIGAALVAALGLLAWIF